MNAKLKIVKDFLTQIVECLIKQLPASADKLTVARTEIKRLNKSSSVVIKGIKNLDPVLKARIIGCGNASLRHDKEKVSGSVFVSAKTHDTSNMTCSRF